MEMHRRRRNNQRASWIELSRESLIMFRSLFRVCILDSSGPKKSLGLQGGYS